MFHLRLISYLSNRQIIYLKSLPIFGKAFLLGDGLNELFHYTTAIYIH